MGRERIAETSNKQFPKRRFFFWRVDDFKKIILTKKKKKIQKFQELVPNADEKKVQKKVPHFLLIALSHNFFFCTGRKDWTRSSLTKKKKHFCTTPATEN